MSTVSVIPGFYTPAEAAEIHGVDHSTVCRWIQKGRFPKGSVIEWGRQKLIEQRAVHEFVPPEPGNPAFKSKSHNDLEKSEKTG